MKTAAILIMLSAFRLEATSIIIVRAPHTIYAAADSLEGYTEYRDDGTASSTTRSICKIAKIGPYYAAVSGITRGLDGFNVFDELNNSYASGDSLAEWRQKLLHALPSRLADQVRSVRLADKREGLQYEIALQLALFGIERGKPRIATAQFQIDGALGVKAIVLDSEKIYAFAFGSHSTIDPLLAKPDFLKNLGKEAEAESLLNRLIEKEASAHPDTVGGPLSFVNAATGSVHGYCSEKN